MLRLRSAPATDEDSRIWWHLYIRMALRAGRVMFEETRLQAERFVLEADRRDADLMFALERTRRYGAQFRPADYPYPIVMSLMRAELTETGTFNWHSNEWV